MKRYDIIGGIENRTERADGYYVLHSDADAAIAAKDAELAKLKEQRDRLAWDLFREHEKRSGFSFDGEEAIEAHGMRLNERRDGVEEIGNG